MSRFKIIKAEGSENPLLVEILDMYPDPNIKIIDGFDDAVLGIDIESMRLIYSSQKIIQILMDSYDVENRLTAAEVASEYFDFNIRGSKGEGYPIFCDDYFC